MASVAVSQVVYVDRLHDDLCLSNIARRDLTKASSGKIGSCFRLEPTDKDIEILSIADYEVFAHAHITFHMLDEYVTKSLCSWRVYCLSQKSKPSMLEACEMIEQVLAELYPISWKRLKEITNG